MDKHKFYISTIDENAYRIAQKYGFGLEIAQYCTAWNMDTKFDQTNIQVEKQLSGINRRILHAPFNELFPCAIDPKARELAAFRYQQAIQLALQYHAEKVVIHGGYNPKIYYPSWYTEQSILFWNDFIKKIPENIVICLENVFEDVPDMLLDIVREVDSRQIRLCLDLGHINAYSSVSVPNWLETCCNYVSHFHVHNNFGIEDTHNALWEGSLQIDEFAHLAANMCPDATYTLETVEAESSVHWLIQHDILR